MPLLVDFHPHGSTGTAWQNDSPYPKVTDADGVIVAFPSAVGDWNAGPCCAETDAKATLRRNAQAEWM